MCFYKNMALAFCAVLLLSAEVRAESSFLSHTNLKFHKEDGLELAGHEQYTLNSDKSVLLLRGTQATKNLGAELNSLSEKEIQEKLLGKAVLVDALNSISDRKITAFKLVKAADQYRIQFEYSYQHKDKNWTEVNQYVVNKNDFSYSSIVFPDSYSNDLKKELRKVVSISTEVAENFEDDSKMFAVKIPTRFLPVLDLSTANAGEACDENKYVIRGKFSPTPGSALFSFERLSSDIKGEFSKEQPDEAKLKCLTNFYKLANENAEKYWKDRGLAENCINSDGSFPEERPESCSESTNDEMERSLAVIDRNNKELVKFLNDPKITLEGTVCEDQSCADGANLKKGSEFLTKMAKNVQESMCCSNQAADAGPLFKHLSRSVEGFDKYRAEEQINLCLSKMRSENSKGFIEGTGECLINAVKGFAHAVVGLIKGIVSLFDMETYKGLVRFVMNISEEGPKLMSAIADVISSQASSLTSCMSNYERVQYACHMIPEIAANLLAPGMILKFLRAVSAGIKGSAMVAVIGQAISNSPKAKAAIEAAKKAGEITGKVKSAIGKPFRYGKALGKKTIQLLGSVTVTPIKTRITNLIQKGKSFVKSAGRAEKNQVASAAAGEAAGAESNAIKVPSLASEPVVKAPETLPPVARVSEAAAESGAEAAGGAVSEVVTSPKALRNAKVNSDEVFRIQGKLREGKATRAGLEADLAAKKEQAANLLGKIESAETPTALKAKYRSQLSNLDNQIATLDSALDAGAGKLARAGKPYSPPEEYTGSPSNKQISNYRKSIKEKGEDYIAKESERLSALEEQQRSALGKLQREEAKGDFRIKRAQDSLNQTLDKKKALQEASDQATKRRWETEAEKGKSPADIMENRAYPSEDLPTQASSGRVTKSVKSKSEQATGAQSEAPAANEKPSKKTKSKSEPEPKANGKSDLDAKVKIESKIPEGGPEVHVISPLTQELIDNVNPFTNRKYVSAIFGRFQGESQKVLGDALNFSNKELEVAKFNFENRGRIRQRTLYTDKYLMEIADEAVQSANYAETLAKDFRMAFVKDKIQDLKAVPGEGVSFRLKEPITPPSGELKFNWENFHVKSPEIMKAISEGRELTRAEILKAIDDEIKFYGDTRVKLEKNRKKFKYYFDEAAKHADK